MELVRLNIRVPREVWRKLRDIAEEHKVSGKKSSVEGVVLGFLTEPINVGAPATNPEPREAQG
jgi:hypothetical protein